jgi:hypothetical protein
MGVLCMWQETFTTGRLTQCVASHYIISGHDEDLDAGKNIRFTKKQNGITFHRFQQYYSVFPVCYFQLGYHNGFQANEKLLEKKIILW